MSFKLLFQWNTTKFENVLYVFDCENAFEFPETGYQPGTEFEFHKIAINVQIQILAQLFCYHTYVFVVNKSGLLHRWIDN